MEIVNPQNIVNWALRKELVFVVYPGRELTVLDLTPELTWEEPGEDPVLVASVTAAAEEEMLSWYADFQDVFSEDGAGILADNTEHDHAIEMEPGKVSPHLPIYNLSQCELELLRKYLKKPKEKGWIRESKSPAGAPILFVPKI